MIGLRIDKSRMFFDREPVMRRLPPAKRKALNRAGGMVRQTMRRSMRFRKRAAPVGLPPSAHRQDADHPRGPLLKDRTFYAYDDSNESVVSGPEQLGRSNAPDVLEHGGEITTRLPRRGAAVRGKQGRNAKGQFTKASGGSRRLTPKALAAFRSKLAAGTIKRRPLPAPRTVRVDAHPFAAPALEQERPHLAGVFADVL